MSTTLLTAARHLIERYAYEIAPDFVGAANWAQIWRIERRFGLIGYGEQIERRFRVRVVTARRDRLADQYATTHDPDVRAWLADAQSELNRLCR